MQSRRGAGIHMVPSAGKEGKKQQRKEWWVYLCIRSYSPPHDNFFCSAIVPISIAAADIALAGGVACLRNARPSESLPAGFIHTCCYRDHWKLRT